MKINKTVKIGDRVFVAVKNKPENGCNKCFFYESEELNCVPNDDINACADGDTQKYIYKEKKQKKA